jgi:hypothetical protein
MDNIKVQKKYNFLYVLLYLFYDKLNKDLFFIFIFAQKSAVIIAIIFHIILCKCLQSLTIALVFELVYS